MRRSKLSLITAAIILVLAVIFVFLKRAGEGVVWVAIGLGWLVIAAIQRAGHDSAEPFAGRRLLRRFSRLLLFWS